jgi:hypothetical protein
MGSSSPEEKEIEEFLCRQTSWVRKFLQGEYALTPEEQADFLRSDWPEVFGTANDEFLRLVKQCPAKLREYRKREVKTFLSRLPSVAPGAPRKDALAREARDLQQTGLSQPEIARTLNRKYPDLKDRKGNIRPITAEGVRKLLSSRRKGSTPDKI